MIAGFNFRGFYFSVKPRKRNVELLQGFGNADIFFFCFADFGNGGVDWENGKGCILVQIHQIGLFYPDCAFAYA
jgi:hypothetical protein